MAECFGTQAVCEGHLSAWLKMIVKVVKGNLNSGYMIFNAQGKPVQARRL
jgi:hypothetical protein